MCNVSRFRCGGKTWFRGIDLRAGVFWGAGILVASVFSVAQSPVLTYHADNSRSGLYSSETLLTPSNVNVSQFGKLFSYSVDGFVAAQPLYVPGVQIPGQGTHNVVYVTTQHDSVFAFDADNPGNGAPLWQTSFIGNGVTTVPISVQGCKDTGYTEVGSMGTPVIDLNSGTLYVTAKTMASGGGGYQHQLHALDITTGLEKFGGPVVISASILAPNGKTVPFNAFTQFQRSALLLSNGTLYIAFGSNGCDKGAHGWLFAYDPGLVSGLLQQLAVLNTSPDLIFGASIWMTGNGPAADSNGNVFLATANGGFDFSTGGPDLGDSVLELDYASGALSVNQYFTPEDQSNMNVNDLDLGSGGVMLLPAQTQGPRPNLMVAAGKTGTIYLIDRDDNSMGGYNNNADVQALTGAVGAVFSSPVYWNNGTEQYIYYAANADSIKAFSLSNGLLSSSPALKTAKIGVAGIPAISANGQTNGILWIPLNPPSPLLAAFDAGSLVQIYTSNQNPTRDGLGSLPHFATPMVANGKVYVGTQTQLVAYGLFPALSTTGGTGQTGAVGSTLPTPLSVQAINSSGTGVAGVSVAFTDGGKGGVFNPSPAITDSTGTATTSYTLPTKPQTLHITATAAGYTTAPLTAVAVVGPATAMAYVSGNSQSGTAGTTLPTAIAVRLHDAYNNSVVGAPVSFSDNGAGGTFSATTVNTAANGQASVTYTLPSKKGRIKITASYSTFLTNFAETAQ